MKAKKTENNKVLMEKFKGFDIFYDKDHERFVANKDELDLHFEARDLWGIKQEIVESLTEEVNKEVIIKTGYFNKRLAKVCLLTMNKATKYVKYKVLTDTEDSYDVEKIKCENDTPKLYELSEYNLKIYSQVEKMENDIKKIEAQQVELINQLK